MKNRVVAICAVGAGAFSNVALAGSFTEMLGIRVGYQVRHNTDVPPGIDKTDTLTTVGLIYEMK